MSRLLIGPSALTELRALRSKASRRRLVARLSELSRPGKHHRISGGGRCRLLGDNLRVLYRQREDDTLVITAIARVDDAVDSSS